MGTYTSDKLIAMEPDEVKKPKLVLDVDGVILNFGKVFAPWWNEKYGHERGIITENPKTWNFGWVNKADPTKTEEIINLSIKEYLMTGAMFPLMDEKVPNYINALRGDYQIHLVTSYPADFAFLREENLSQFGIKYDSITFVDGHKIDAIKKINPVGVIEDCPYHIRAANDAGFRVFIPEYWNYTHAIAAERRSKIHFYKNWEELVKKLALYANPSRNKRY